MVLLKVLDETTTGVKEVAVELDFEVQRITVRELLEKRVYQEVADFNRTPSRRLKGLVEPAEKEKRLNEPATKKPKPVDWKKQYEKALKAFEKNQFLVLVNKKQVTDPDEEFDIDENTEVSFLKIVPLAGG